MDAKREAAFFTRMIAVMLQQLKRIAGSTQGEHSVDDLKNEAYLIAHDVRAELGENAAPDDERLQATVISKLQKLFGRFANRPFRFAARLDADTPGEDGDTQVNSIAARLAGPESLEPHQALEQRQHDADRASVIESRYSEAVAYLRVLAHFDNDRPAVADHLALEVNSLDRCINRAARTAEEQPSMFDGIASIPTDFVPPRRQRFLRAHSRPPLLRRMCSDRRPHQFHFFVRIAGALSRVR